MFIFFAHWREIFRTCGKVFPAALSKLNFSCSLELWEKCFSDEKRSFFQFQTMNKKITATQQEVSAGIVNTPFPDNFQKKDLRESFFFEKPFS